MFCACDLFRGRQCTGVLPSATAALAMNKLFLFWFKKFEKLSKGDR